VKLLIDSCEIIDPTTCHMTQYIVFYNFQLHLCKSLQMIEDPIP